MSALPFDGSPIELDDQEADVPVDPPAETMVESVPNGEAPRPEDALLLIYADALDDFERVRIANENRVRSLRQVKGMEGTPEEAAIQSLVDGVAALEHGAELLLKRAVRKHPLGPWIKRTVGIGEKQGARLLAAIGDPYWNSAEDRPRRGPAELWAYCGYHVVPGGHRSLDDQRSNAAGGGDSGHAKADTQSVTAGVAPRPRRGHKANWNATAKMRARLVAESCMKQRHSPYRAVYDAGRSKYAACEITDLHKHNRALRLVAKAILRDLWIEARRVRASAFAGSDLGPPAPDDLDAAQTNRDSPPNRSTSAPRDFNKSDGQGAHPDRRSAKAG